MALTPESLTEQQRQPLARSSHSVPVVAVSPEEMEMGLLSREVVLPNSGQGLVCEATIYLLEGSMVEMGRSGTWFDVSLRTVKDNGDFLAVAGCEDIV